MTAVAKTLLMSYPRIKEQIVRSDKKVDELGRLSQFCAIDNVDMFEQCIDWILRKNKLFILKNHADCMVRSLDVRLQRVLLLYFFGKRPKKDYFVVLDISKSTFYDLLKKGVCECAAFLKRNGLNEELFVKDYGEISWLVELVRENKTGLEYACE